MTSPNHFKTRVLSVFAAIVTASTTLVTAQPYDFKSTEGTWNIFVNEATQGCFMEHQSDKGIVMQIGTEAAMLGTGPNDSFGFVAIYVPGERPVDVNPEEVVVVKIGPNTYAGVASTVDRDGYHGGVIVSRDQTLEFDLKERRSMEIISSSGTTVTVNLAALKIEPGLDAVIACQREITG
ncbi:MAG: hypothetical protein ABJX32_18695 [Tateyamaria sp.]|uniref:hypothetical protein n=1 Tax=Tateyamaria sp. TaxID=1929288 RepID=UPI00329D0AF7